MSREEVAALVCQTLRENEVDVVLSGGSVVSIYTENAYESYDLDFIQPGLVRKVDSAMQSLGFAKDGRHWTHPSTAFFVEFPVGPVAVGDMVVRDFAERQTPFGILRLLAPTECVMDRLTWYFHNNDRQCLEQAVEVARRHPIDIGRVRSWARAEGQAERFSEIADRLSKPLVPPDEDND